MYLYEIIIKHIGLYIDVSIDPLNTYKTHLHLLRINKHSCYKLQYLYNDKHEMDLNIISFVPKNIATFAKIQYIQKQNYIVNSLYPVIFDYSKYKGIHYIHKPSEHICKINNLGIEVDVYGVIEEDYYNIHNDHLERIDSEAQ